MTEETKKVSRRKYIVGGAAVAAAAVIGGAAYYLYSTGAPTPTPPPTTAPPTTAPPTTAPPTPTPAHLDLLITVGPEPEAIGDVAAPLYEKKHPNILFTTDVSAREYHEEKLVRELTEKQGRYDLIWIWTTWQPKYGPLNGLEDLNNWIVADEKNADPMMVEMLKTGVHSYKGQRLVWPSTYWGTQVLHYRKDLWDNPTEQKNFENKYGYELKAPKTWDEMYDMAEFFNRPPDLYGHHFGAVGWNTPPCVLDGLSISNGTILVDANEKIHCTDQEYIDAFDFGAKMCKFNPPGWESQSFFDGEHLIKDGKLAMQINWEYPWPDYWNADKCPKVFGKMMWAAMPKGRSSKAGHFAPGNGGGLCITVGSKNKRAAADFIQWLDSFEAQKAMALTGALGVHPGRTDVAADPEFQKVVHYIKADYWDEYKLVGVPWPTARVQPEVQDLISQKFINVANGTETAANALDEISRKIEDVMATW